MKRLIIFTGLKLAEILGVCGIIVIIYGVGLFAVYLGIPASHKETYIGIFGIGFVCIFGLPIIIFLSYGIYRIPHDIIKANWAWADRISKGKK